MTAENSAENTAQIDERSIKSGALFRKAEDPGPVDIRGLAVAAATRAGRYVPGRDSVEDALAKCVYKDNLTEKILKLTINDDGKGGPAHSVHYEDAILDADGTELGKSSSNAVVVVTEPHMWQFHKSTVELVNGSYEHNGLIDVNAMMRGMTQVFHVTGISGEFEGKTGFATITIGDVTQQPPTYAISYAVC
ncbi:allene oxide cyclase barrel-like domain-containing protein [Streptomyces odontomachi]|uniref:allene oxide cyclase barrel-like domain-containing protein n=1 Tax=Streptomyces odontomachi TaxID=2944940 RepID=UPI00210CB7DF|nr:hypothetical protein [Streptomyces sp. ODS25]